MTDSPAMTQGVNPVLRAVNGVGVLSSLLNRVAAVIAATLLVLMTLHILVEIGMRFFGHSTFMADALVGYGVAAITFLALSWALEQGSMIRVSVLTGVLPLRGRRIADAFATLSTLALILFLASHQWAAVSKLFARGSVSQHYLPIPLWIPEGIFLTGLLLLALQLVVRTLRLATGGLTDTDDTLTL